MTRAATRASTTATAFAAGAGLAGGSGSSASQAARLALVDSQCSLDWDGLPRSLHPTQAPLFGSDFAGAIIMNVVIIVGIGLVSGSAFLIVDLVRPGLVRGFSRFWSAAASRAYYASEALFLGITIAAMRLIVYPGELHSGLRVLGFVSVLAACAVPVAVARTLRRIVPKALCYREAKPPSGRIATFLLGPGEWVATEPQYYAWVDASSTALRGWKEMFPWWLAVDAALMFAIAVASTLPTYYPDLCTAVRFALGALCAVAVVVEFRYWPHCRERDNWADVVLLGLQAVAHAADGLAMVTGSSAARGVGTVMMMAGLGVLFVKCLCDVLCYFYVARTQRRTRVQQQQCRGQRPKELASMLEDAASSASTGADRELLSPIENGGPSGTFSSSGGQAPRRSSAGRARVRERPGIARPRRATMSAVPSGSDHAAAPGRGRRASVAAAADLGQRPRRGSVPAAAGAAHVLSPKLRRASAAATASISPTAAGRGRRRRSAASTMKPLSAITARTDEAAVPSSPRRRGSSAAPEVGSTRVGPQVGTPRVSPRQVPQQFGGGHLATGCFASPVSGAPSLPVVPSTLDKAPQDIAGSPLWGGANPPPVPAAAAGGDSPFERQLTG